MINENKKYCYRIAHISNLGMLLKNGIVNKQHRDASKEYIEIGNREIIDVRNNMEVKIADYGNIGDYIPFYFTPKSVMLLNIISGYRDPVVKKRERSEILVIRCLIKELAELPQWFFTDGQGNDITSCHHKDLNELDTIDWDCIQNGNFSKNDGDYDRLRRYQAEFLVHQSVPLERIESLNVYSLNEANSVFKVLHKNKIHLAVNIQPQYYF